jgi:hypothetical protein
MFFNMLIAFTTWEIVSDDRDPFLVGLGLKMIIFMKTNPKCSFSFKSFSACVEEIILVGCFLSVKVGQNSIFVIGFSLNFVVKHSFEV